MPTTTFESDVRVQGNLTVSGTIPLVARSFLTQEPLASYLIPWTAWRIWDVYHTNLPGTGGTDDLALIGGTFATAPPTIQTGDLKAAGSVTRYARAVIQLPPEYDDATTVQVRFYAGMKTTISDTTATIDLQAYEADKEEGISSDLVTTSATSINNLLSGSPATTDFSVTATALVSGDWLDMRVAIAINDGASGTAVIGIIGSAELLCDIKG